MELLRLMHHEKALEAQLTDAVSAVKALVADATPGTCHREDFVARCSL